MFFHILNQNLTNICLFDNLARLVLEEFLVGSQLLNAKEYQSLKAQQPIISQLLMQDPRPHYHTDATRVYGMEYAGFDIRFTVAERVLTVVDIKKK